MIISHKYKFIYIKNPKSGSTSIEKYLKNIDPDCISTNEDIKPYGHETYEEIKELLSKEIFDNYFKFTFFRNPINWFISQFAYNAKYCFSDYYNLEIICNKDGYIEKPENNIMDVENIVNTYILLKKWFEKETQLYWINENLDFIGQFENIDNDFEIIKKKLNINSDNKLPKLNNNNSDNFRLSEDGEKIVKIIYKKDIELYDKLFNNK